MLRVEVRTIAAPNTLGMTGDTVHLGTHKSALVHISAELNPSVMTISCSLEVSSAKESIVSIID